MRKLKAALLITFFSLMAVGCTTSGSKRSAKVQEIEFKDSEVPSFVVKKFDGKSVVEIIGDSNDTAASSVCAIYNDYLDSQCVDPKHMEETLDREILAKYSVEKCRKEGLELVFKSDKKAAKFCQIIQ